MEKAFGTKAKPGKGRRCDCSDRGIFLPPLVFVTLPLPVVSHMQKIFWVVPDGSKLDFSNWNISYIYLIYMFHVSVFHHDSRARNSLNLCFKFYALNLRNIPTTS